MSQDFLDTQYNKPRVWQVPMCQRRIGWTDALPYTWQLFRSVTKCFTSDAIYLFGPGFARRDCSPILHGSAGIPTVYIKEFYFIRIGLKWSIMNSNGAIGPIRDTSKSPVWATWIKKWWFRGRHCKLSL